MYKRLIIFDNIIILTIIMLIYFECIVVYLQRLMDTMLELSFASDFVITMKKSNNFIPYVYYYYFILYLFIFIE